jgi:predicted dithiol-disulfide oxidoreductase (DUF899 family)
MLAQLHTVTNAGCHHMKKVSAGAPNKHRIVSHQQWLAARTAFLVKEKAFTREREALAKERRELPWEKIDKRYVFQGPQGEETLADLFEQRPQLIVVHFMFNPEAKAGCAHCSFWADHYDGMSSHLTHRNVTFVVVSRAPLASIEAFRHRMGWKFKWVSSGGTDFNYDFQASFRPTDLQKGTVYYNYANSPAGPVDREGVSVFCRDVDGAIFHTYSSYARGIDMVNGTYQFLDLVPRGRDEDPQSPQSWVRYHDQYED